MNKKKDFLWRYQPPLNSDKAKMLSYIQNQSLHPFEDKTTMIITALNAYYMALALYSEGSYSGFHLGAIQILPHPTLRAPLSLTRRGEGGEVLLY